MHGKRQPHEPLRQYWLLPGRLTPGGVQAWYDCTTQTTVVTHGAAACCAPLLDQFTLQFFFLRQRARAFSQSTWCQRRNPRVLTRAEAASPAEHAVARGGGSVDCPPLLTRLLGHVARSGKKRSKAHRKSLRKYFGHFFAKVNIQVTRGHLRSNGKIVFHE